MTAEDLRRTGARSRWMTIVLVACWAAALPASLEAQQDEGPAPLSKADVIRLLTSDTYSESQIDRIVRRSCLSFRMTDRDREDFRELGASPSILAALTDCSESASVTLTASPDSLHATVGDTVSVTIVARRGDAPAEGIPLSVPEAVPTPEDAAPVVTTNSRGEARFRIAAGRRPMRRSLEVTSPEARTVDAGFAIPFLVEPAGPAAVRVRPDVVNVRAGERGTERVLVTVADRFGNGVSGAPVVARGDTTPRAEVVANTVTDSWGEAVLRIPGRALDDSEALGIWAGGNRLARVGVRRPESAPVTPVFVAGHDQRATPGQRLADPLVVEVRTPTGEPAPGRRVTFGSPDGSVLPFSAETDTTGRASVTVWAAADGAPTTVSAAVGDSRAETTVHVAEESRTQTRGSPPAPDRRSGEVAGAGRHEERGARGLPGRIASKRRAVRTNPADGAAWLELAEAWRDAARPLESRLALLQARSVASGNVRDSVDEALADVYGAPPGLRVEGLWGRNLQQGAAAGPRFAEARFRATTFLEVWGRYDRSLPREVPGLLRGPDELDAYYGGAEVEWGPDGRAATVLELGQRELEDRELVQNMVRIEQEVRFPTRRGHVRVRGGGVVGRWHDRDDWLAYVRGAVPVTLSVDIRPSVSVGETVGTDFADRGRVPAREVRGGLGVEVRPTPGMQIIPVFRYGRVEADVGEGSDSLWEAELAVSIPIAAATNLELIARRQSPPRSPEFTILAAGLRFGIR